MDDKTFELLKRIDAAFEEGSGDNELVGFMKQQINRGPALKELGASGSLLRRDIMQAVEAEKRWRGQLDIRRGFGVSSANPMNGPMDKWNNHPKG